MFTFFAVLLLAGTGWGQMSPIVVKNAWVRPTPPGIENTAMYAEIHNMGEVADRLVSASTARAMVVEIHEVKTKDGMMQMSPVKGGISIPAKGMASLQPGGFHLMVIGLDGPVKKGETITFELTFEKAGKVLVQAAAEMRLGSMQGMGHGSGGKTGKQMNMKK